MTWFAWTTTGLIAARCLAQLWLDAVNRRHVQAHAAEVPQAFKEIIDSDTYAKSVQYTLAKSRLSQVESVYDAVRLG